MHRLVARPLVVSLVLGPALFAQCEPLFLPGSGVPGTDGPVTRSVKWDPDGAGPANEVLVFTGSFGVAGPLATNGVATYDDVTGTWGAVGGGFDGYISNLAVAGNGDLIVGGFFSLSGGLATHNVARFDGTTWHEMNAGMPGGTFASVSALFVASDGTIYCGGSFDHRLVRWNGSQWLVVGGGLGTGLGGFVGALTELAGGDIMLGGAVTVGGSSNLGRWDGAGFQPVGTGVDNTVHALLTMPNGDVIIGGSFDNAGGVAAAHVARWDGSQFHALGSGTDQNVGGMTLLANGDVLVAGNIATAGGVAASSVARWDGSQWSSLGFGNPTVTQGSTVIEAASGRIYLGGAFALAASAVATNIAVFDGATWSALGTGSANTSGIPRGYEAVRLQNGDLVVAGQFTQFGGVAANNVARFDGSNWHPLGSGIDGIVNTMLVHSSGDLIVGGSFPTAGGVSVDNVARWDGVSWHAIDGGTNGIVEALHEGDWGVVLMGGSFTQAGGSAIAYLASIGPTWTNWTAYGMPDGPVNGITGFLPGQTVFVGSFATMGGFATPRIARWTGLQWAGWPAGIGSNPRDVAWSEAHGLFVVDGTGVRKAVVGGWAYTPFGGQVRALETLPGGDLVAGGFFTHADGTPADYLAQFDGTSWQPVSTGTNGYVRGLAVAADGDVLIAGDFTTAGGEVSSYVATLAAPCPPAAVSYGNGCAGSGLLKTLTADSLPWTGETFHGRAVGIPPAFALEVFGFTQVSLPLSAILPVGAAGCELLVSPDAIEIGTATLGLFETELDIPSTASLAGLVINHQVVALEVDAMFNFTEMTSTNALALTIGTL